MGEERRKPDNTFKYIIILLSVLQFAVFNWVRKIDSQASQVPVIASEVVNLKESVKEIKDNVRILVQRR